MKRVVSLLLLAACADVAGGSDAGRDAPSDATTDVTSLDAPSDVPPDAPSGPWRSALYPEAWDPTDRDSEGRFLHDFSYAGYRNGESALGADVSTDIFDVADFGADPSGMTDTTEALQAAIDAASAATGVVWIPGGTYRVEGVLRVSADGVVLRGEGPELSRLHFATLEGMGSRSHLVFAGNVTNESETLLGANASAGDIVVTVEDPSGLAVGDDVDVGWVVTPEFVADHAMTDYWMVFNDAWQPFFRREVRAIEGNDVTLDVPLRYAALLRDGASIRRTDGWLSDVGIESLGVANAGHPDDAWAASQVHAIELVGVADAWVRDVASFVSPTAPTEGEGAGAHLASGGMIIRASKRVTVADTVLAEAQNRGGGGNGYLFEIRTSSEVLFRDCTGRAGRHNFITNWGFGTSGIVWLRVRSEGGRSLSARGGFATVGLSDYHHSLATANLVDSSVLNDGWSAQNRFGFSSGAGHGATESVFWNTVGEGTVRSHQFGHGYVIGTGPALEVATRGSLLDEEPEDWSEGLGRAADLIPTSLYEDQLARRLGR